MPNFTFNENGKETLFQDIDRNWSDYGTLTFKIKVNSDVALQFDGLKIQINDKIWVTPAIKDMRSTGTTIEADGNIYTITLDMNRLYPFGNIYAATLTSDVLDNILSAEFRFTDTDNSGAEFCIDDICFRSDSPSKDSLNKPNFKLDLIERIKALFISFYVKIIIIFNKLFK